MLVRKKKSSRRNETVCILEQLENRQLMSGTVTASVVAGDLIITGDNVNNQIAIKGLSGNRWQVTGLYGTKINGLSQYTSDPVTNDMQVTMADGNDVVKIKNGEVPHILNVFGDDGNNKTVLKSVTVGYGLGVYGNAGNDRVRANNVTVQAIGGIYYSVFSLSEGKNVVKINNLSALDFRVYTGAGVDHVTMRNSTLQTNAPLTIETGDGADCITVARVQSDSLTVNVGDGNKDSVRSALSIANSATFTGTGTNGIIAGVRNDFTSKTIDPNFVKRRGDLV